MPFPLLAHQAVVLPLKMAKPRWFDGTALVIGSIAPDLEYLRNTISTGFTHTLVGQAVFCVPFTIAFVVAGKKLGALRAVGARVGWSISDLEGSRSIARVAASAVLASASHVALDRFSRGALASALPSTVFRRGALAVSSGAAAQLALTAILSLLTALCLVRMHASHARERDISGRTLVALSVLVGLALGLARAAPAIARPGAFFESPQIFVWGFAMFHVASMIAMTCFLAGVVLALRDRSVARAQ